MKKLLTFLTLLTLFFGVGWAAEVTITSTDAYNDGSNLTYSVDDITISVSGGTFYESDIRVNKGQTLTVSSSSGNITSIVLTMTGSSYTNANVNTGSYSKSGSTGTWTGNSANVQFTAPSGSSGNQLRIKNMVVTYTSGGSQSSVGMPDISFSSFSAGNTSVTATITNGTNGTSSSYKIGESGSWQTYNTPIEFDLTEVASPITVYAKSSDGTDESDETYSTFTLPTLAVSVSPLTYSGYAAQTVTITPSNYVGDYTITYTINDGTATGYTAPFTLSDPGTYEIVATINDERAGGTAVISSTATITINEAEGVNLPFVETFAEAAGDGPSGDSWSGSTASGAFKSDNEGWAYNNGYAGYQCARFGKSGTNGYATTPLIKGFTANNEYTLTFKAGAWNNDGTTLSLTASNGTFKDTDGNTITSVTMSNNAWTDYEVIFVPSASTSTITFTSNNNRFFLDEINVTEQSTTVADGYYLFGQFNDWATGDSNYKFTQQSDGSYKLTVSNYTANNQYKFAKYVNGTATLIGVDNSGDNYGLHSTHHTNIAMNTGNDTYSIKDSGEMIFTIHADETAYDVDKQVYMKGTYNSWANEAMTLTADGWTITKQLAAGAELGFVDSWGSGIWHGCGDNQNNLTVDQSKLDTDLSLWTDGKNFYFPTAGNYSFTVSRDLLKVVISLVPESYAITCTATPEGTGTVTADKATATAGETVTLTVTPSNSNYEVVSVTVNDEAIAPVEGVYSFTMPAAAANVVATFAKIQYTITKEETNCTISFTDGVTENNGTITSGPGDEVKFTVTPITSKYVVSSVIVTWPDGSTTNPTLADGVYSFTMQGRNAVVTAICVREAVGDGSFVLVTDATTLNAGDKVIITNSKTVGSLTAVAMSTTQNDNNRGEAEVTIVDGPKITPSASVQVFTLEGDANGWYFNTGNGYIYAASSTKNYLRTETTKDDNAKAEISITNDVASIVFQGSNTRNVLQYNTSGMFSCYSSASQSDVYLFKQTAAGLMVEIDPDGGQVIGSQEVTIDANVEGAMVQFKIGDGEWSTPAEAPVTTTITGNVGDEVVVYAKATMDDEGETLEDETSSTFTFVAPAAPTITPASCSIASETQTVTITSGYADGTIEYSTDGGATWTAYNGQFNVVVEGIGQSVTVQARVTYNGVVSEVAEATYTRGVQPVVFSPASGTYYGDQTCQMFSTTKGARIYYTTDGSEPVMNQGTTQLYTGEVSMPATGTYNFKAVAYIGTTPSEISSVNYTIKNTSEYVSPSQYDNPKLYSVAELNAVEVPTESPYYTTSYYEMVNPVQVIYMSTYKQNGYQPEFCLVRDNTGYGMIYFGKQNTSHNNYSVFNMGDWIGGGYSGQVSNFYDPNQQVLSDTHPELGRSGQGTHIYNWIEEAMSNSAVLPEYLTIPEIKSSDPTGAGNDYWGHYVHLRKNTIELVQSDDPGNYTTGQDKDGKWSGTITDENGQSIMYYDKFYLQIDKDWTTTNNDFTGHPNRTFDVYGFVACYKNVYQVSPFDFAWIDKPVIDKETTTYYEPQTVTLSSPEDPTATIWYKTDDMDDYAVYTEPFEVNSTTTVSWYATKQSQYNDELESLIGEITMTFEEIAKPVISPESVVKAVGESVDASIAFETGKTIANGAEIVYTTDGSDPKTSETAQVYTLGTTMNFNTTTTVRAITRVGSGDRYLYSAEADAKTYTFVKSNGIEYTLIDNVTKLKENGVYVIVSQNYSEAISTTQNVNNRGAAGVLFVEGTNKAKVYGNDDVAQFTLSVLTHDEDTSPERHFLMQTNNSNVNGYLYVGHDVQNTLMTEAEEDAMGNDVAVITIDADGRAHIHFNYAGGDNRYLQYWNRDRLFNTYKSEYDDRAVYIYGIEATPLATIEKEGVTTEGMNQYTIADQLLAVYADGDKGMLWCKDQGNVSIAKTEKQEGQIDFMKEITEEQTNDWDQSNWVVLQFSEPTIGNGVKALVEGAVGKYIKPATIQGTYTDALNYTITMADDALQLEEDGETYVKNLYCTANFLPKNLNINGGQGAAGIYHGEDAFYFFMNPKVQEVCEITYAEWEGNNTFIAPLPSATNPIQNDSQIDGAFTVDWTYNVTDQAPDLTPGAAYRFLAVVQRTANSGYLKSVDRQPSSDFIVYPLNLDGGAGNIVTGINKIDVDGSREVKSVKYVNVAGMVSDKPFSGVNIVVTEYTDGSRTTSKMLRK